ncbi:3-hydroxyacyl-CoA dehydrogenase family protein [Agrococcus sp. SGAir0287]|uniref:3-hydroxyacyl-CoA dehydrogenase family protein n=1 Tax=Agrococcus sp. SGAir0287 TaxID=2070347 RepID=UPI0010CD1D28|nr:3-hydroxyacyl-CoA dehydrogenase family protein [Agrococcus sp. SGAir0287]QCR18915.1 3-hydroxyacyl-CoA dehydrogenase [Agrococcus sp. SGAir0287]
MTTTWRIAVLGSGLMGAAIARTLAAAGHAVRAYDPEPGRAAEAVAGTPAIAVDALTTAVEGTDLVLEAAPERLDVKHALLAEVEPRTTGILASNSSTFTPSQLAEHLADPGRLLVTHWFNPADLVPLVEVVPHPRTPAASVDAVVALLEGAGKHPVALAREVDGFVGNRLQAALVREAMHLVETGVATREQVDAVVRHGLGPRWAAVGPLRVMELGGLDVWEAVADRLLPSLGDATEAPAMLREAAAARRVGTLAEGDFGAVPREVADADRARIARRFRDG